MTGDGEFMRLVFVCKYFPVVFIEKYHNRRTVGNHDVTTFLFFVFVRGHYNEHCFKCSAAKTLVSQKWRNILMHNIWYKINAKYRLECGLGTYLEYIQLFPPRKQCNEILKSVPALIRDFGLEGIYTHEQVEERLLSLFGIPYITHKKERFII